VFGIVAAILTPQLNSPIRTAMQQHANLVAYCDRITSQYFSGQSISSQVEPAILHRCRVGSRFSQ
jgi:hypothetical protein